MHQSRQKLHKVGFRYVQKIQVKFVDTKLNSLTKMGKINENKAQVSQNFENQLWLAVKSWNKPQRGM